MPQGVGFTSWSYLQQLQCDLVIDIHSGIARRQPRTPSHFRLTVAVWLKAVSSAWLVPGGLLWSCGLVAGVNGPLVEVVEATFGAAGYRGGVASRGLGPTGDRTVRLAL